VRIDGGLVVRGSHIELRDLEAELWKSELAEDQTFRDLDVDLLFIRGSSGVRVLGGDVGPSVDDDSQVSSLAGQVPRNLLFDGVYFHDARKESPSAHTECLQFGSGVDVVVRASRFRRCSDHDLFIRSWGTLNDSPHPLRGFTIENNFFDKTLRGYYSLRLAAQPGWPCEAFLIRNNSALQNMYSDCEARDVRFLANIQPSMSKSACRSAHGAVWDWNVYRSGMRCRSHDVVAPRLRFQNAGALDLHLRPRSPALGRAASGVVPSRDIDGQARPRGGRADAGADER
jgi:hypothetical protein